MSDDRINDAVNVLTAALALTVGNDPSVDAAIAAFAGIGLRVTEITLKVGVELEPMPEAADAEFLRD